jgi:hypothetical protein
MPDCPQMERLKRVMKKAKPEATPKLADEEIASGFAHRNDTDRRAARIIDCKAVCPTPD